MALSCWKDLSQAENISTTLPRTAGDDSVLAAYSSSFFSVRGYQFLKLMAFSCLWSIWLKRKRRIFDDEHTRAEIWDLTVIRALLWASQLKELEIMVYLLRVFQWYTMFNIRIYGACGSL